jgi:hypothetical protein
VEVVDTEQGVGDGGDSVGDIEKVCAVGIEGTANC